MSINLNGVGGQAKTKCWQWRVWKFQQCHNADIRQPWDQQDYIYQQHAEVSHTHTCELNQNYIQP